MGRRDGQAGQGGSAPATGSGAALSPWSGRARLAPRQARGALLAGVVVTLLAIGCEYSGLDLYLAGLVYEPATGSWPYRSLVLTSTVLHTGGRHFVVLLGLTTLLLLLASYRLRALAPYRRALIFTLLTAATGPAIVSLLKSTTHIYTPWSLARFGGDMPYVRLFDGAPAGSLPGHAFPGGHASGGFAWFGPYFLLLAAGSRWRRPALLFPLLLGGVFALTQELRGAHFLSHDLISLAICWTATLCWALVYLGGEEPAAGQ
ncbi:MAG: phosphatase PAP2 family protein [Pseudomonadota bacterium]